MSQQLQDKSFLSKKAIREATKNILNCANKRFHNKP